MGGRGRKCFGVGRGGGREREKAASGSATMSSSKCLWSKLLKVGDSYIILGRWQNRLGYFSPIS